MTFTVRPARTSDVRGIQALVEPLVQRRILLGKDLVVFFEAVQEFRVAVAEEWLHAGVGAALLADIERSALDLGLTRLFCLTFETEFFGRHGFEPIGEGVVAPDVFVQLTLSPDEGVAEFLDLARVKQNTLGNTRMLKTL